MYRCFLTAVMFTAAAQTKEIKTTIRYSQRSLLQRILCLQKIYGRQFFDDRPKLHGHACVFTYQAWSAGWFPNWFPKKLFLPSWYFSNPYFETRTLLQCAINDTLKNGTFDSNQQIRQNLVCRYGSYYFFSTFCRYFTGTFCKNLVSDRR